MNIEIGLNDMTPDPLFLILARLEPLDVLRVCQINKRFQMMGRNPALFRSLLQLHYPNSFGSDDPKEHYKAVMVGFETTYKIPYSERRRSIGNPVQCGITQWPHRTPGFRIITEKCADRELMLGPGYIAAVLRQYVTDEREDEYISYANYHVTSDPAEMDELFRAGKLNESIIRAGRKYAFKALNDVRLLYVPGYPILPGTKAWLLTPKDYYDISECKSLIFKTKEMLAEYLVKWKYRRTLQLKVYLFLDSGYHDFDFTYAKATADDLTRVVNSPRFQAYSKLKNGRPFTKENLYNHILENDEVWLALDKPLTSSERILDNTWLFKEITF